MRYGLHCFVDEQEFVLAKIASNGGVLITSLGRQYWIDPAGLPWKVFEINIEEDGFILTSGHFFYERRESAEELVKNFRELKNG